MLQLGLQAKRSRVWHLPGVTHQPPRVHLRRAVTRIAWVSVCHEQIGYHLRMREHWIVARIDLDGPGSEKLGGSPLESLRRITSQTPHDEGAPVESPKMFEAHCTVARGPWERRAASQCP